MSINLINQDEGQVYIPPIEKICQAQESPVQTEHAYLDLAMALREIYSTLDSVALTSHTHLLDTAQWLEDQALTQQD